jgi:hypothetical protein
MALHYFAEPKRRGPSGSISSSTHSFIHLPFSCCSWRPVLVPCKPNHSPLPSPVFLPVTTSLTAFPAPITIVPPASVSRPRRPPHLTTTLLLLLLLNWFVRPHHPAVQSQSLCCALPCVHLTALGRSLIAGSCPFPCVAKPNPLPLSALKTSQEQKQLRLDPPTNQQQIALVSIHRAPAASRGFSTPFLYQGPLTHPQLVTAPPQENVAASQHKPSAKSPCIITHWVRSTNKFISTQNTTGYVRSGPSAVIALFGQPPSRPSLGVSSRNLWLLARDKPTKYLDVSGHDLSSFRLSIAPDETSCRRYFAGLTTYCHAFLDLIAAPAGASTSRSKSF